MEESIENIPICLRKVIYFALKDYKKFHKRTYYDGDYIAAYMGILDCIKKDDLLKFYDFDKKENIESIDIFRKLIKYAKYGLQKFSYSIYFDNNIISKREPFSLNREIIDESEDDLSYFYSKNDNDICISTEFFSYYNKLLLKYGKNGFILRDYFNACSKMDIIKKYNISYDFLKQLVINFRKNFNKLLLKYGYLDKSIDVTDDFEDYEYYKNFTRRKELKKVGVEGRDFKIYKLLKNISIEELSIFLDIDINSLNNILNHRYGSTKLWLYQIQKLRKKYFSTYSFEELLEIE